MTPQQPLGYYVQRLDVEAAVIHWLSQAAIVDDDDSFCPAWLTDQEKQDVDATGSGVLPAQFDTREQARGVCELLAAHREHDRQTFLPIPFYDPLAAESAEPDVTRKMKQIRGVDPDTFEMLERRGLA